MALRSATEAALKSFKGGPRLDFERRSIDLRNVASGNAPLAESVSVLGSSTEFNQYARVANQERLEFSWDSGSLGRAVHGDSVRETVPARDFRFADLRCVGQIFGCYLLCELEQEFYVVDMHAAHERYNYNLIRNSFRNKVIAVQKLLLPIEIAIDDSERVAMQEHAFTLESFGFEIEQTSTALNVLSTPAFIAHSNIAAAIREVLATPLEASASGGLERTLDGIAARLACHASIRSGDILAPLEIKALFQALDNSDFSAACPHGRPVIISFHQSQVERWFGRDG